MTRAGSRPGLVVSVSDTLKRIAWSRKPTRVMATGAVNAVYLARKHLGLVPVPTPSAGIGDVAEDLRPFHRYRNEFGWIDGWFKEGATVTWDALLAFQRAQGLGGNVMEIGVLKGKSAALMALHSRLDETCVFVDPALRREAIDVVEAIRPANNVWLPEMSQTIRGDARLLALVRTFRWIHIDGEHTGRAVVNDLEIAEELLSADGIICLDDFMSPAYPQVTMAAFRFLERLDGECSLFLNGFNKGYICRAAYARVYLQFLQEQLLQELKRRGAADVTIWKTTEPSDMNCFGLTKKYADYEFKGPDWAPHTMPI